SNTAALTALKRKDIDVFISYLGLLRYDQHLSKGRLEAILIEPRKISFATRKQDRALQQLLNRALDSMWSDGTLYAIKKKYLAPVGIEAAEHSYK
ncbi:MAG: transporter substrate-binding domain-containing protein, partial [Gammaproteobacteria bacterium]